MQAGCQYGMQSSCSLMAVPWNLAYGLWLMPVPHKPAGREIFSNFDTRNLLQLSSLFTFLITLTQYTNSIAVPRARGIA